MYAPNSLSLVSLCLVTKVSVWFFLHVISAFTQIKVPFLSHFVEEEYLLCRQTVKDLHNYVETLFK